jgi:signal transduction histidine kinase
MAKFLAGKSQSNKFKFLHKNGNAVYLSIDSNIKPSDSGDCGETFRYTRLVLSIDIAIQQHLIFVVHIRCFSRNDTERRLEEELLEVQNKISKENAKAKATFIRNVFHEIRTPLHALSSFFSNPNPLREEFVEMKHHTG